MMLNKNLEQEREFLDSTELESTSRRLENTLDCQTEKIDKLEEILNKLNDIHQKLRHQRQEGEEDEEETPSEQSGSERPAAASPPLTLVTFQDVCDDDPDGVGVAPKIRMHSHHQDNKNSENMDEIQLIDGIPSFLKQQNKRAATLQRDSNRSMMSFMATVHDDDVIEDDGEAYSLTSFHSFREKLFQKGTWRFGRRNPSNESEDDSSTIASFESIREESSLSPSIINNNNDIEGGQERWWKSGVVRSLSNRLSSVGNQESSIRPNSSWW